MRPVSVVISTLDRRELLRETLLALRDQTHDAFEVIVVNGPSVDGTAEMLRAGFAGRARLLDCPVASLGASRNIGIAAAACEIVAFIDDDAIAEPGWLEELARPYDDPAVAAVGGPVFDVPLDRVAWRLCTCTRLGVPDPDAPGPISRYAHPGADPFAYLPGCNMSYRRGALAAVGNFNRLLAYNYDDAEICMRLTDAGARLELLDAVLVRHLRAPNAARDADLEFRDPYPSLYCRSVFVHQAAALAGAGTARRAEIEQTIAGAARDLALGAEGRLRAGSLSPESHRAYLDALERAVADGARDGAAPRPVAELPPADPASFLPYR